MALKSRANVAPVKSPAEEMDNEKGLKKKGILKKFRSQRAKFLASIQSSLEAGNSKARDLLAKKPHNLDISDQPENYLDRLGDEIV